MKARALIGFSAEGGKLVKSAGEEFTIKDEKLFLDLYQAGFVEQVDQTSMDAEELNEEIIRQDNEKAGLKARKQANAEQVSQKKAKANKK